MMAGTEINSPELDWLYVIPFHSMEDVSLLNHLTIFWKGGWIESVRKVQRVVSVLIQGFT